MTDTPVRSEQQTAPPARKHSRFVRVLRVLLFSLLALIILVVALVIFVLSPPGLQFALERARPFVADAGGRLETDNVSGSLWSGIKAERFLWSDGQTTVQADGVDTDWALGQLLQRKLVIDRLHVASLRLELPPSEPGTEPRQAVEMPGSLALPIEISVREVRLDRFELVSAPAGAPASVAPVADARAADETTAEPLVISQLGLSLSYADGEYSIDQLGVSSPWGDLSAGSLSMGAESPHPLSIRLDASGKLDPVDYQIGLRGDGDLNALGLNASGQVAGSPVQLRSSLNPLALSPLRAADLTVERFQPRVLGETLPEASLDLGVKLRTRGDDGEALPHWRIEVQAANAGAGALNAKKIPVHKVETRLILDDPLAGPLKLVRLQDLAITLPATTGLASIKGQVTVDLATEQKIAGTTLPIVLADLAVTNLDIAQFATPDLATSLSGGIALTAKGFEVDLKQARRGSPQTAVASASGKADGKASVAPSASPSNAPLLSQLPAGEAVVRVSGRIDGEVLRLAQALLQVDKAKVHASGSARIVSPVSIDLQGGIERFDLNQWIPRTVAMEPRWRQGMINGTWTAKGIVEPAPDLQFSLVLNDSLLAGNELAADISAGLKMNAAGGLQSLSGVKARVGLGRNRITASGGLGAARGAGSKPVSDAAKMPELTISLNAPDPAVIDPRVKGSAELEARLSGALEALVLAADLRGRSLRFAPDGGEPISLRSIDLRAKLPLTLNLPPDAPLLLDVELGRLQVSGQRIDRTTLTLKGSTNKHQLRFGSRLEGQSVALVADGRAELAGEPNWQGTLSSLTSSGKIGVRLSQPVPLKASAKEIELDGLKLLVSGNGVRGGVTLDRLFLALGEQPNFIVRGGIDTLPFAQLASAFVAEPLPEELNGLRLDSGFDLTGSSAEDLTGKLSLEISEVAGAKKPVGLTRSRDGNQANLSFSDGNLSGRFALSLPSLAFTRRFTEPDLTLDGQVELDGTVSGRVTEPKYNARLNGSQLEVEQSALGLVLDKGKLDARLSDRTFDLRQFVMQSGEGKVEVSGRANLLKAAAGPKNSLPVTGAFDIDLSRFSLSIGPGQRIVLSGKTRLLAERNGLSLRGDIKADEGLIEVAGSGAPSLPGDVQIVQVDNKGKEVVVKKPDARKKGEEEAALKIDTLLNVNLGEQLRVTGSGLNARLTGGLKIKGELPASPRVDGLIKIVDGSYKAYSQDLSVRKGEVTFNGPVENPAINIEAVRPNLPVTVGVAVRGTASSPRIELFSDPNMGNPEILSWLVLGVPIEDAQGGAQSLAIKEAASRLLGSGDSSGGSFSDKLGLDSLGFGYASDTGQAQGVRDSGSPTGLPGAGGQTAASTYQEVVTLGKQLSDRLSVSYEQGVSGLWNLLQIQYKLNNRLSVRAQTGSESAVDLLYFWSFD